MRAQIKRINLKVLDFFHSHTFKKNESPVCAGLFF
jgi:hypothetical protein